MLAGMWLECGCVHDYETTNGRKDSNTWLFISFRDAFFSVTLMTLLFSTQNIDKRHKGWHGWPCLASVSWSDTRECYVRCLLSVMVFFSFHLILFLFILTPPLGPRDFPSSSPQPKQALRAQRCRCAARLASMRVEHVQN